MEKELVEYRLYHPAHLKADRMLQRDVFSWGSGWDYWDYRNMSSRRRELKKEVRDEFSTL
eukprot:7605465-Ditylum_brightwellii.AAC.1